MLQKLQDKKEALLGKKRNTSQRTINRTELFRQILSSEEIDIRQLEELCFNGIPEDRTIKAICWKLLLGYLPKKPSEWKSTLQQKRNLYEFYINLLFQNPETYNNGQPVEEEDNHHNNNNNSNTSRRHKLGHQRSASVKEVNIEPQDRPYSASPDDDPNAHHYIAHSATIHRPPIEIKNEYFQEEDDQLTPKSTATNPKKKLSLFDDSDDDTHAPKPGLFSDDTDEHDNNENRENTANTERESDMDTPIPQDSNNYDNLATLNTKLVQYNQTKKNMDKNAVDDDVNNVQKKGVAQPENEHNEHNEDDDKVTALSIDATIIPNRTTTMTLHNKTNSASSNLIDGDRNRGNSNLSNLTDDRNRGNSNTTDEVVFMTPSSKKTSSLSFKDRDNSLLKDLPNDDPLGLISSKRKQSQSPSPPEQAIDIKTNGISISVNPPINDNHDFDEHKTPKIFCDVLTESVSSPNTPITKRNKKGKHEKKVTINGIVTVEPMSPTKSKQAQPIKLEKVKAPDPLSKNPNNPWKTYFDDWEIWNRIKKDIHRTHQTYAFFRSSHMISEKSASKRYRFPFDISSDPGPMTPSVSSTMPLPSFPGGNSNGAGSGKPLIGAGHSEPPRHVNVPPLVIQPPEDDDDDERNHHKDANVTPHAVHTKKQSNSDTYDDGNDEHSSTETYDGDSSDVVIDDDDKKENKIVIIDQYEEEEPPIPKNNTNETKKQSMDENDEEDEEENVENKENKMHTNNSSEVNENHIIHEHDEIVLSQKNENENKKRRESLLKTNADDEIISDIESLDGSDDEFGETKSSVIPVGGIGCSIHNNLPPPAPKNIKFRSRSSLSASRSAQSTQSMTYHPKSRHKMDPNKKARIERYVMDSKEHGIHSQIMIRILCVYARLNKGIEYVQGMNELLAPIYYIFTVDPSENNIYAEADAFFCFMNLMSYLADRFIAEADNSQLGIIAVVTEFDQLLERVDNELWTHLKKQDLDSKFYALRWLMLLMAMEFQLPEVLRLWDSFLSDHNRFQFVTYFALSMITKLRSELLAGNFANNLQLLQKYPSFDLYELLLPAIEFRKKFPLSLLKKKKRKKRKIKSLNNKGGGNRNNSLKNRYNLNKPKPNRNIMKKSRSPINKDIFGNILRPHSTRASRSNTNTSYRSIFRSKSPQMSKSPTLLHRQQTFSFSSWRKKFGQK